MAVIVGFGTYSITDKASGASFQLLGGNQVKCRICDTVLSLPEVINTQTQVLICPQCNSSQTEWNRRKLHRVK